MTAGAQSQSLFRFAAAVVAEVLILTSLPVSPASANPAPVAATVLYADPVPDTTPPPPPQVTVNKTVPTVAPVPLVPVFSAQPTDAEIFRARVFGEPFVPTGPTTADENKAFSQAILSYVTGGDNEDVTPLGAFLDRYPGSAWRASLLTNLGSHYQRKGYFTRSQGVLTEAWALARQSADPLVQAVAGRALTELLDLHMRFGRAAELEEIVVESDELELHGGASDKVAEARRAVHVLRDAHHEAIASAAMAVDRYQGYGKQGYSQHSEVAKFMPKEEGASLAEVKDLAGRTGESMRMVKSPANVEDFPVPSIVHLKQGHFTALVKQQGDSYLLADPILGSDEFWISRAALQEEASGYFLIREAPLPAGWSSVLAGEAEQVRGKCEVAIPYGGYIVEYAQENPCKPCQGMARYGFNSFMASLIIGDSPLGYSPPRGPGVEFLARYDQRDSYQPQIFSFSNLGKKWRLSWLSYLEDDPGNPAATIYLYPGEGGKKTITGWNGTNYAPELFDRTVLVRTSSSPIRYERQFPDGSVEVYSQSDGAVSPRRVFLTETRDPQGNALTFTYDSQLRLVSVTDAIGQVTTLSYQLTSDPLKVTKVTDPFGRIAKLDYDTVGALVRITDVIGIVSELEYGLSDFIRALTTPYGTTTFAYGNANTQGYYWDWWLEATDPLGGKERIEYVWSASTSIIPSSDPANLVPLGFVNNTNLNMRNSFYWDKRATALYPGDYTKARIMRWLNWPTNAMLVSGAMHSEKKPLENRVWYGQAGESILDGTSPQGRAAKVGRVLDDGTSQIYRYEYNSLGKVTRQTDPLGRETILEYDANGLDLLRVKQKNPASSGGYDLLETRTYNSLHEPLTGTDAAGQTTTYTYNTQGQLLTATTPPRAGITENRTTTYAYDTNGYLQTVTRPATGATTTYTYDGYGRMRMATDSDGYGLTYDYDALDRPTKITYPDGTYEETVYNRLDPERRRDRLGRWTHTFYDALRRPVTTRDPLGRTTTNQWCNCGSLDKLIDANGNATMWERDLQGRVTREVRANGSAREYTYETTTGRLKKVKDAKNQETQLSYFLDDHVQQVSYVNAQIATPSVSYTFDPVYGRPVTMTDGTGTTTYTHHPVGTPPSLGAGLLASVDGPLSNDTITHSYDELGRVVIRTLNGVTTAWAFDALGRLTTLTDPIGAFTYSYVDTTVRLNSVTYPNGQTTSYAYLPNTGDRRLQDIHHKKPDATTLSRFTYGYDADGNAELWTQQSGTSAANAYDIGYNNADEITSAVYRTTDPAPVILKRYGYAYDPAGNRTSEQIDDTVTGATYDNMNRLVSQQPGGALLFKGTTNEAATVTVGVKPATTTPTNVFTATAPVPSGTSTMQVQATDPSGNVRTNTYQVSQAGTSKTFTYDANGNLSSDGTRTYEWDAADRLVTVKEGASTLVSFTYDGSGRRATKMAAGVTTSYVHDAADILELRLSTGSSKRFVQNRAVDRPLAEVSSGVVSYLVADHLGSVTERTDGAGSITLQRRYDPWGRILTGGGESGYAFTGREWDEDSDLYYYRARHYDAATGRFLSEDPIGLDDGPNRYAYVQGNPINRRDPSGTASIPPVITYCVWNPLACGLSAPCTLMAEGIEHILTNGKDSDDDRANALKHCAWACCMAQLMNRHWVIAITDAYEGDQRWTAPCSSQMDRHNNMLGVTLGSANPNKNCFDMCNNAGSLQCETRKVPILCTSGD